LSAAVVGELVADVKAETNGFVDVEAIVGVIGL
jgi:hypothetical protein